MFKFNMLVAVLVITISFGWSPSTTTAAALHSTTDYGFGHAPTDQEVQHWDIDVSPTGAGLPSGRGTVKHGAAVYSEKCASCHGATGQEGPMDRLVGGQGTLASQKPIKTIGSYWPFATTLYDYIHRAMPFNAPQSLTNDEIYSVVAWLLHQNGIISTYMVLDAKTLPTVEMPNRNGFVPDSRPDVSQ